MRRDRVAGIGLALGLGLLAQGARAEIVSDCGKWAGPEHLIEPWAETSRTFSQGSVRVAAVDLGEPEGASRHLIVLIPANMYGGRACFLLARNALMPNGWAKIGISEATAWRDGTPGLMVSVPVYSYDARTGGADPDSRKVITLRIRQAAGTVELEPIR